ncbi:hypothetical protein LDENG_00214750 [Lucifuga dentata]|nr:hypothetical protein LDENG_00214750 [Lucifuga dentata]
MQLLVTFIGSLCILGTKVSADDSGKMYGKVGGEVVLSPGSPAVSGPISSFVWKHAKDLAMEWIGGKLYPYRHFKERGHLNTSTGALTISGLTPEDSGLYTAEINYKQASITHLQVISAVPKPVVSVSCDTKVTLCTLSCDGNTMNAEPLTYSWTAGDMVFSPSSKELNITQEDNSNTDVSCMMKNPVSVERSEPITNLFSSIMVIILCRQKAGKGTDVRPEADPVESPTGKEAVICLDVVANSASEQPEENSSMLNDDTLPPDGVTKGQPPEDSQTTDES